MGFSLLVCLALLQSAAGVDVVRSRTCTFEPPGGVCGWSLPGLPAASYSGIRTGREGNLGPSQDVNPGSTAGHYVFFYTNTTISSQRLLVLASYQYVCGLSFSYYARGPFDLAVVRFNGGSDNQVYSYMNPAANASMWQAATYNYTVSQPTSSSSTQQQQPMYFEVTGAVIGESEMIGGADVFLALDNVTLTFCLPCDYDGLVEPGAIIVGGPQEINVTLRQSVTFQFNATSPACPNETLAFTIEAVEPWSLRPIFSIDRSTGLLEVDGTGPSLNARGLNGHINVSVHIVNSNYSQDQDAHKEIVVIPFTQPPTISTMAAESITIDVTMPFSYQVTSASQLGQNLDVSPVETFPSELSQDVSIRTVDNHGHTLTLQIYGQISLNHTLPQIVLNNSIPPYISIPISDDIGGIVYVTTNLVIGPSPPIFEFPYYEFGLLENTHRGATLGHIRVIDPNGHTSTVQPVVSANNFTGNEHLFMVTESPEGSETPPFSVYVILVLIEFDYEVIQQRNFEIVAVDSVNSSLSSTAMVRINILPVNEFPPVFVQDGIEVTISDNLQRRGFVAAVSAEDADDGSDGIIDYRITGGNDDGYFALSGTGFGEVVVRKSPINPHTYHLTIIAYDRGRPSLSATAVVTVNVIATSLVNCTDMQFGLPILTSSLPAQLVAPVSSNLTLSSSFKSNPEARGFKWERNKQSLIVGQEDPHYIVTNTSLTIEDVNSTDGGFYYYNVTNQCGSTVLPFLVTVIDHPNTPTNVRVVDGPYQRVVAISWDIPAKATDPVGGRLAQPTSGYVIQGRDAESGGSFVNFTSQIPVGVTTARLTTLHPGTLYEMRVLAVNVAGATPSQSIMVHTDASVPQMSSFRSSVLPNNSVLLEWQLEFDGGFAITEFAIHLGLHNVRPSAIIPAQPDLVYHKGLGTRSVLTSPVPSGYSYTARAVAVNSLGQSPVLSHNVFVGSTDFSVCNFEPGTGCPWQTPLNAITVASASSSSLPSIDATSGTSQGHYLFSEATSGSENIMATLPRAGYACSLAFSYYLSNRASARLDLVSSSDQLLWSSIADGGSTSGWTSASLPLSSQYFTANVDDSIKFVASAFGANTSVAMDGIAVTFCLPCDFEQLRGVPPLSLTYTNNTRVFLRTPQSMPLEVGVSECPNAALNYSIVRVIPSSIASSFSLDSQDGRNLSITIDSVSPSLVEPNSIGYLEVLVSVMNTDYKSPVELIGTAATVEFLMVQAAENCTFGSQCLFSDGQDDCSLWVWGSETKVVDSSQPNINQYTGEYLYSLSRNSQVIIASAVINESFCQVSFSFVVSQTAELMATIQGVGVVWSSVETVGASGSSWVKESIRVDLRDAEIVPNRTVSFMARLNAAGSSLYAGMDNLTLHPCIDCNTPVCTFISCLPGHYYSLDHESCLVCPKGYYCPDWRIAPKPCPVGTYGSNSDAKSINTCLACPADTFAIQPGSTSCLPCPDGFSCTNASEIPVHLGQDTCTIGTPTTSNLAPVLAGLGAALGACCLVCLCISVLLAMTCHKRNSSDHKDSRHYRQGDGRSGRHSQAKNYGKSSVRTLTSFLSYNSNVDHLNEGKPWSDVEDMTGSVKSKESDTGFSMTFTNDGCEDSDDERELIELRDR